MIRFKTVSVLLFCAVMNSLYAQQVDVGRSKWFICLKPAGAACNDETPCMSNLTEHIRKDPCEKYDYWYMAGDPPVLTKATCCSQKGMVNPPNEEKGLHPFQGEKFYLSADTLFLMAQCISEGDTNGVFIANLNVAAVAGWESVVSNVYVQGTDTLVVELYEGDTLYPYYKPSSKVTVKYGPEIADDVCAGGGSFPGSSTGMIIMRTPKVTTDFYPNPVSGNDLTYSLFNPEAIDFHLKYEFVNVIGEVVLTFIPETAEGKIDISGLSNGLYMIKITSDFGNDVVPLMISR